MAISSKNRSDLSLKRRFLKHFFWGTLVVWSLAFVFCYKVAQHELNELYDGELAQTGRMLLSIYGNEETQSGSIGRVTSSAFEGGENYERKLVFQIWNEAGDLLIRSANAPVEPLTNNIGEFKNITVFDNEVRVLAIGEPVSGLVVHVGQNLDFREESARETLEPLLYLLLIAFPVSILIINRGLNRGVQSLRDISEEIAHRTGKNLDPIEANNIPTEIRGIVDSLNNLMQQVKEAFDRERQFIADAAHELRTPLAGIKAQAQVALKNPDYSKKSLGNIIEGVDRTASLANQLLTLSGVDSLPILENARQVKIKPLLDKVLVDLSESTQLKSQSIVTSYDEDAEVWGDDNLLYTLFRNLIENASRYSPHNSEIQIQCQTLDGNVSVILNDQGAGIPAENRQRVFDRFYRQVDSGESGSGLGLAIAKQIASLHQAEIKLRDADSGQGLRVEVIFGRDS